MKKINLSGITPNAIARIIILIVALINAAFQMVGYNTIPIADESISEVVSTVFLVVTGLYNAYKNFNVSEASQTAQEITNSIKNGEIAVEEIQAIVSEIKNNSK